MSPQTAASTFAAPFDVERVRADFPMLAATVHGKPLVYLDNAATTQKPRCVIDRLHAFYACEYAKNDEEHALSRAVTRSLAMARERAGTLINAASAQLVSFAPNATDALHVIADGFARTVLRPGDEVIVSALEHHSNIVPWMLACKRSGAVMRVAPIDEAGDLDLDAMAALLSDRTRVVAVAHVSHVLGTVVPVSAVVAMAHARGVPVVVDGAQATPHLPVDVTAMECDFYVGCGHKTYGPTSLGILYGSEAWLERIPPRSGGSDNVERLAFKDWRPKPPPLKFEAGTPAIADIVAFATAVDYLEAVGLDRIREREERLDALLAERLSQLDGVRVLGEPAEKVCVTSFVVEGLEEPTRLSAYLDAAHGIAVRAGTLSAQPLMNRLGVPGAVRASLSFYNTEDEIEALVHGVRQFLRERPN